MLLALVKLNLLLLKPKFYANNASYVLFLLIYPSINLKSLGICLLPVELLVLVLVVVSIFIQKKRQINIYKYNQ